MNDVNLIPSERLASKRCRARLRLWTVICGAYLIALTTALISAHAISGGHSDAVAQELKSAEQTVEQHNATIRQLREELAEAGTALITSRAIIDSQLDWSKLLILLGDQLGQEVVLNNCQLAALNKDNNDGTESFSPSAADMGLAERRYRLKMSGLGRTQSSVSQFVLRLERIGLFDSVTLVNSYRQPFLNGQAVAFSVECSI